jgi:uncharacterized membrane protein YeaQ/YmgE (transglycosylase-associated protein family)
MDITISDLIIWLIIGAFAGAVTGALVKRKKEGYGRIRNLAVGMAGALIGGALFKLFKIDLKLADVKVTAEDLISALAGSFLLMFILWLIGKKKGKKAKAA